MKKQHDTTMVTLVTMTNVIMYDDVDLDLDDDAAGGLLLLLLMMMITMLIINDNNHDDDDHHHGDGDGSMINDQ